jgi:hypothetical protein
MMLRLTYRAGTRLNDWSHSAILGDRGVVARNFADLVAARMIGTVLPFSERESLVKAAARHGINRFEANLLIAAVQHQMGAGRRRLEKTGGLRRFGSLVRPVFVKARMKFIAAVQNLWRVVRQWAIAKRVWPGPQVSAAIAATSAMMARIVAAVQSNWQATRQWAIERQLWPVLRIEAALATVWMRILAAVQDRPEFVRLRSPRRESARMRISSALATFVAVQAGIVAAAWYLFSY